MDSPHPHVLLVTFPFQGHINPSLRFGKRLLSIGIDVTFATSIHARQQMEKTAIGPAPIGLSFAPFSDGFDDGFNLNQDDHKRHMTEIKNHDSTWPESPKSPAPSALLWIQPATVLDLYYYYLDGAFGDISSVRLSALPQITFSKKDHPCFVSLSTSDMYNLVLPTFKEQFDALDAETRPKVLFNKFDALHSIERYDVIGVGPLVDADDRPSFKGDLFGKFEGCIEWLDSKPKLSVVYVSFVSLLRQTVPVGGAAAVRGGVDRVRRRGASGAGEDCGVVPADGGAEPQSLWCGVPVVALPVWLDQGTNAKMIEEEWGTGVRVGPEEDGKVSGEEITRCIERVMEGGEKMRENAARWKGLAREAVAENGSSYRNLKAFLQEVRVGAFE
ncbi:UDP-Glycosyltransferase superfamily protein [Striga asiatica]|uniref:UDP-Glycosyltransferase superfamily protein n=1 Tax=Striga asiatica TaxID=4170 RepID=A0A5A7PIP0_STRAF|nr:UDP-Glycosyltransferase superfamily protein [Striga asiatica]